MNFRSAFVLTIPSAGDLKYLDHVTASLSSGVGECSSALVKITDVLGLDDLRFSRFVWVVSYCKLNKGFKTFRYSAAITRLSAQDMSLKRSFIRFVIRAETEPRTHLAREARLVNK